MDEFLRELAKRHPGRPLSGKSALAYAAKVANSGFPEIGLRRSGQRDAHRRPGRRGSMPVLAILQGCLFDQC